jgi:thimet oligopeptidase
LNDLDIAITEEDVNGNVWKDVHPDLEFREEAAVAQRILGQLMGEVMTSLEIAHNLAILENTEQPFTRDEKRLLAVCKRNLRRGGAYLNQGNKERVRDLTNRIVVAEEEFLTNIREDSRKLELDSSILPGLPEDYLASHPVDPCTGKFTIDKKMSNVSPILMYCHEQSTREKVYRFLYSLGSPANESVLLRLLGLRRQKAQTLGYSNWAEYQIESQMARTVICATAFIDDCARAITTISDAEQNEIIKILRLQSRD